MNVEADFTIGGSNDLTIGGNIDLKKATRTITVSNTGTTTFSGKIKNSGDVALPNGLIKAGAGTLVLNKNNSNFDGGLTVNAGVLQVNNATVLGPTDGADYLGGGTVTLGSGGTVEINGNLTLEGSSMIGNGGTLQVSGDLNYDSTTLTSSPNITLTPAAGTTSTISISSAATSISGVGEFTVNGGSSVSTVQLDNNLSATGLTITEGDLSMAGNVTVSGDVTLTGGSLTDNGGGLTVSGDITSNGTTLSGTPDITVNNSGAAAVNGSTALSGVGTFTKTGGGTLTVNQDVNAATISLNQGTLLLGASNVLGGSVALAGGSLALASGISETVGTLTLSSSSTISFGGGDESLTFSGASSWTGGTQLTITNYDDSGSADDQLFFTGSLSAAQLSQIKFVNPGGFATGSYDAQIIGGRVTPVNVIPEPSTWIAMILIGFVVAFRERSALGTGLSGLFRRNDKDRT
jgi:autotransporter-associated beta strand protein